MSSDPTKEVLEQALAAAGKAHHDYETNILGGVRDEQWPGWYAAYVLGRLGDFTSPSQLSEWLVAAPYGDNWATSAASYVQDQLKTD